MAFPLTPPSFSQHQFSSPPPSSVLPYQASFFINQWYSQHAEGNPTSQGLIVLEFVVLARMVGSTPPGLPVFTFPAL